VISGFQIHFLKIEFAYKQEMLVSKIKRDLNLDFISRRNEIMDIYVTLPKRAENDVIGFVVIKLDFIAGVRYIMRGKKN
jgi:hypothetical protein